MTHAGCDSTPAVLGYPQPIRHSSSSLHSQAHWNMCCPGSAPEVQCKTPPSVEATRSFFDCCGGWFVGFCLFSTVTMLIWKVQMLVYRPAVPWFLFALPKCETTKKKKKTKQGPRSTLTFFPMTVDRTVSRTKSVMCRLTFPETFSQVILNPAWLLEVIKASLAVWDQIFPATVINKSCFFWFSSHLQAGKTEMS